MRKEIVKNFEKEKRQVLDQKEQGFVTSKTASEMIKQFMRFHSLCADDEQLK